MLRLALEIADRILRFLPSFAAYALADLVGNAWRRSSPARRRMVGANLRRVCEATGRPTGGPEFDALVRSAFRNHARYYLELLRAPRYPVDRIAKIVDVPQWEAYRRAFDRGPIVFVGSHLGNFEPFGTFLSANGIRPLAPIEEIKPAALYRFLAERRGGGGVDLVPVHRARGALTSRLRAGGLIGIIGDRDLTGDGRVATLFGHRTTVPTGPATLAVLYGATVIAGRCIRIGPDRFQADGDIIEPTGGADRRAEIATLTDRLVERFEHDIGEYPDQWWGAFQQFWPDLGPTRGYPR